MIKQSKNHIIIEPNSNGFDKYLIQEIIQEYAKSELLNIIKQRKLFKVVIINKIDNLSYYAQASLRRTMEIFTQTARFILSCNFSSKLIDPIQSRCTVFRFKPVEEKNIKEIVTCALTDQDYQNALKAWISPLLAGSAPFNNPNKNVVRPLGEKYPGFFRDIFAAVCKLT